MALLGDAAHPMAPDLGQGACQAILDAWSIASELAATPQDPAEAFKRYQRARRPRAAGVTLAARALTNGGGFRGGPMAKVRETATPRAAMLQHGRRILLPRGLRRPWRRGRPQPGPRRAGQVNAGSGALR